MAPLGGFHPESLPEHSHDVEHRERPVEIKRANDGEGLRVIDHDDERGRPSSPRVRIAHEDEHVGTEYLAGAGARGGPLKQARQARAREQRRQFGCVALTSIAIVAMAAIRAMVGSRGSSHGSHRFGSVALSRAAAPNAEQEKGGRPLQLSAEAPQRATTKATSSGGMRASKELLARWIDRSELRLGSSSIRVAPCRPTSPLDSSQSAMGSPRSLHATPHRQSHSPRSRHPSLRSQLRPAQASYSASSARDTSVGGGDAGDGDAGDGGGSDGGGVEGGGGEVSGDFGLGDGGRNGAGGEGGGLRGGNEDESGL